jgi:hypothetical protein
LRAKRAPLVPVGVKTNFPLTGDFEITGSYQVLSTDQASKVLGLWISLYLESPGNAAGQKKWARLCRVWGVQGKADHDGYLANVVLTDPMGKPLFHWVPTAVRAGQLRLKREGTTLRFLVGQDGAGEIQQIFQTEYGTDDIAFGRLVVNTGEQDRRFTGGKAAEDRRTYGQATVDARLVDLRIRLDSRPPSRATTAAGPSESRQDKPADPGPGNDSLGVTAFSPEKGPEGIGRRWLVLTELLGLVLTLSVVAWLCVRYSRRSPTQPAHADGKDQRARPGVVSPSLAVACSACGKNLRARAELAGKKVKCPECGKAVVVPGTSAEEAHPPSL